MNEVMNRAKEVLLLLASDSKIQVNCFPEYVDIAEEIAMETEEILNIILSQRKINMTYLDTLKEIDLKFNNMGTDETFWNIEAMESHSVWQEIRMLAREELTRQNLNYEFPNLYWLRYINKN